MNAGETGWELICPIIDLDIPTVQAALSCALHVLEPDSTNEIYVATIGSVPTSTTSPAGVVTNYPAWTYAFVAVTNATDYFALAGLYQLELWIVKADSSIRKANIGKYTIGPALT
jgi:hypothetical protein